MRGLNAVPDCLVCNSAGCHIAHGCEVSSMELVGGYNHCITSGHRQLGLKRGVSTAEEDSAVMKQNPGREEEAALRAQRLGALCSGWNPKG